MLPPHSGDARYSERGAGAKHKTRYRWTALMMETDLLHAMDSPGQAVQGHPSAAKRRARGPSRLEGGGRSTDMSQTKRPACPLFPPLERPRRGDGWIQVREETRRTSMVTHSYFFSGCLVGSSVSLFPVWPSAGPVAS